MLLCSLANGTAYLRNHFDELEEDRKTLRKELMALKAKMKKCALLLALAASSNGRRVTPCWHCSAACKGVDYAGQQHAV